MKQKRKVFFTIGDDLQPSHKMYIVSAGKEIENLWKLFGSTCKQPQQKLAY
jgi:hypothetical protein